MPTSILVVYALSDSFSDAWPALAHEAGLTLRVVRELPSSSDGTRTIILVAAGGEEESLPQIARELAQGEAVFAVVGASASHRLCVSVLRAGADDFFLLPVDLELLRSWLKDRAERLMVREQRLAFADGEAGRYSFDGILGSSRALIAALERAARVIPHQNVTVLITGETGTGKELLARAIHYNGPRREGPFVDINCAALPDHLLESELFGHEKGAFTDASSTKPGLFEMARGGTIFLDEIGHLALPLQTKLLRALQERTIRRVGGTRNIEMDVRIIAATHAQLEAAVKNGTFREDLYYRLNVVPVMLPPLRQRRADILPLARHFLARFASEYGVQRPTLSPSAELALTEREWPGNIRQLRNLVERAVLLTGKASLDDEDFEFESRAAASDITDIPFPAPLSDIIHAAVARTLDVCGGNKSQAARRLGISRPRLQRLLENVREGDDVGELEDVHD